MKKFKIFGLMAVLTSSLYAQDFEPALKAIDAEQFEKAKLMLKMTIQEKPSNGKTYFFLGNVYLKQKLQDSAKIFFQKGLAASDNAKWNHIGLGEIELNAKNISNAQAKFDLATADMRRKDFEEYIYVAKAFMNSSTPDFKKALEYLNKAKTITSDNADLQLALGDAFYGDKNQNDAYVAYRKAYQLNPELLRAKMQLGVLLKDAKAFSEADKAYSEVIAINPKYGPVYRELAETFYKWGVNNAAKYSEYIDKALKYYDKYMSLTDYSINSRMRHADFLILARDYKALELEANKMKELDKVNPRILRYLGYAAYENGNIDASQNALNEYISKPTNKIIALDYLYLGKAKIAKAISPEGTVTDMTAFNSGIADIKKAVEMEAEMTEELSDIGKKMYMQKAFTAAASVFEIAVTNPNSKNFLNDNFYLGNAIYYSTNVDNPDKVALAKADTAFGNVITGSPTTQDAYIFRARTNKFLENDEMMSKYYSDYIAVVTEKGADEVAKNKAKFIEAYNNMASHYANSDIAKAKELLGKTLQLDPTNEYATSSMKLLK